MEEGAEAFVSVLSSPVSVFVAAPSLVFPPFSLSPSSGWYGQQGGSDFRLLA